ncbi:hypothetical protein BG006_010398 [Podila minutissima]|uniref:D-xylose 1-dehydrogenase (NADP(+), D-xylono-1,5-lactone-forming) n=1 Tax=Podila minutissima TaxID=64525 RepID=A0A9P5VQ39_9FUNG|nr:hypothetical protein BG006_010398 [Podila minutissima]
MSIASSGLFTRLRMASPKVTASKDPDALRIGTLGAVKVAPVALINPAKSMKTINVVSIAARDPNRAKEFAKKHGIPNTHATNDSQISDPSIDCIYDPLPNGLHYEWTKSALEAGKHVLLEKFSASNAAQTRELSQLAKHKSLVLLEAFHYRFHPALIYFKDLIRRHVAAGHRIERVESVMSFMSFFSRDDIQFNYKLAGGKVDSTVPKIVAEDIDGHMDATMTLNNGAKATLVASLTNPWLSIQTWKEFTPRFVVETEAKAYHYCTIKDKATGTTENLPKVHKEGYQTHRHQLEAFVQGVRNGGGDEKTIPGWVSGENNVAAMEVIDSIYKAAGMRLRQ